MGTKEFIIFAFAFCIVGVCRAQYYGRMRGLNSIPKEQCTCTCEDLASLIALARALEDKEMTPYRPPPPPPTTTPCLSNFEELIMKLVNALVYTATETTKNSCHCTRSAPTPNYSNSDDSLINANILSSNKNNNLLGVDIANQNIVDVGLGGKNYDGGSSTGQLPPGPKPPGQNPTGQNPNGQPPSNQPTGGKYPGNSNSDEGILNLEVLGQNKNNVLDLDVGKQNVLGVGLGGNGGAVPDTKSGYTSNSPNSGGGFINVDIGGKKDNNLLELDVGKQTLVGVGLGN